MKPATYDTCEVCAALWDLFTSDKPPLYRDIKPARTDLDAYCPGHDPFFQHMKTTFSLYSHYRLLFEKMGVGGLVTHQLYPTPTRAWFAACKNQEKDRPSYYGRILDPNWVDLNMVRTWMRDCISVHGDSCTNPVGISPVSPKWLIDIQEARIVPGESILDYVALSYRWGASKGLRMGAGRLDINMLQKPGALSDSHVAQIVPQTIADAIQLVRLIGERYFWVDAICIDQNDKEQLSQQLEMMGAIYASAKLTIVAADGDATMGIRGLEGISASRELRQNTFTLFDDLRIIQTLAVNFRDIQFSIEKVGNHDSIGGTEYFRRGWTHQEFNLSKRRLIFYKKQMFWECTCADWYEDLIQEATLPDAPYQSHNSLQSSPLLRGMPLVHDLSWILGNYNSRQHSYAEDTLPGIIGLLSVLSRSFEGGFLYGLPESCFEAALMWRTGKDPSLTRRRVASNKSSAASSQLPSWSWVGWHTPELQIATGEDVLALTSRTCITTPITQWFTHEFPHSNSKRPINPTLFEFRKKFGASPTTIPPGWTKRQPKPLPQEQWFLRGRAGLPHYAEDELGYDPKYIYCHDEAPEDEYYLPFPVNTNYKNQISWSPSQTPFVSCKTKRGWFRAARAGPQYFDPRGRIKRFQMTLGRGTFVDCGLIEPHTPIDTLLADSTDGEELTVELVAICAQVLRHDELFGDESWNEVYGVLWIEWVDGVAYRKGSGFVYKQKWETHDLEEIDLILG